MYAKIPTEFPEHYRKGDMPIYVFSGYKTDFVTPGHIYRIFIACTEMEIQAIN